MPSDQLDILCSVETWALAPVSSLDGFTGDDGVKYGYCSTATDSSQVLPGLSLLSYTEKKYLAQNQKSRQRGQDDEAVNGATSPSHSERFGETLEERDGGFESGALMRTARGIKTS